MRLKRFVGVGVHGFLKFDLRFRDDLTFLTGINGSGKTSALNAILGLITPDLGMLAALTFDEIALDVDVGEKQTLRITAVPIETGIQLSCSTAADPFFYNRFVPDPDAPPFRQTDHEIEYYREVLSASSSHPVLKAIGTLPTPMFLGLDRRPRFGDDPRRPRYGIRSRGRNPLSGSLHGSIVDAAGLAEDSNRESIIRTSRIARDFQQQMLLNLITVVPGESFDFLGLKAPTSAERQQLKSVRNNLQAIAEVLGLAPKALAARLTPLLDKLDRVAKQIPDSTTIDSVYGPRSERPPTRKLAKALFDWSANQPHLDRIKAISEIAEQFRRQQNEATQPLDAYRALINNFLSDSGKELVFNERGEISIRIDGIDGDKSIAQLSSGEAQLFVILTHLALNPSISSSVFIIDEPEVSLHVRWQEMFVDSLRAANSNVQYILATHSPSIILDRISHCIDADASRLRTTKKSKK
jgi:predicted ATPase